MVYQSYPIKRSEEAIRHLALGVPFFLVIDRRLQYIFCNKQYSFEKKVTLQKGRYKICLKFENGELSLEIEKTGEYIPEKYKL